MANTLNVNNSLVNNNSKLTKKISFNIGETFTAKVLDVDGKSDEVTLRTSDGWNFSAKVDGLKDESSYGKNSKFVVTGFDDGQIKIKFVDNDEGQASPDTDLIEDTIKEFGLKPSKDNIELLKALIDHNIPLTKENISEMKNIIDFNKKIIDNPEKAEEFIFKYIESKNIDISTEEGKFTCDMLRDFAKNLKSLDLKDIVTLFENKIDITGDNIKSFNKIFKEGNSLYNELKDINDKLNGNKIDSNDLKQNGIVEKIKEHNDNVQPKELVQDKNNGKVIIDENEQSNNLKQIDIKDILKSAEKQNLNITKFGKLNLESNIKNLNVLTEVLSGNSTNGKIELANKNVDILDTINKFILNNITELQTSDSKDSIRQLLKEINPEVNIDEAKLETVTKLIDTLSNERTSEDLDNLSAKNNKVVKNAHEQNNESIKNVNYNKVETESTKENTLKLIKDIIAGNNKSVDGKAEIVKQEINTKINNMKEFISNILSEKNNGMPLSDKVAELIKNNINDFKVFNSVSDQYYYMDLPVNSSQNDYQCKLIIKDDRKSGKRVDSRNVKIVTSVKTVNMGVVDAYIKIFNNNLNVKLKCDEKWSITFNGAKEILANKMINMGYSPTILVERKDEEVNLASCRSFFNENNNVYKLDIKV